MARTKSTATGANASTATIGFEAKLWLTADKLRNNMDAAEYSRRALPGHLFYSTQIPVCLWFLEQNEPAGQCRAVSELEPALAA